MKVLILAFFSGLNIAMAILSVFIWRYEKSQKVSLYFGVFSFFSGLYFILIAFSDYLEADLRTPIILCAAVYYALFPWFLNAYVGKKNGVISFILSGIFFLAFVLFVGKINILGLFTWQHLAHLGLLGLVVVSALSLRYIRAKEDKKHFTLFILVVIFSFLAIEEIVATYSHQNLLANYTFGILPLDLFPLFFSVMMGKKIATDLYLKNKLELELVKRDIERNRLELIELERKVLEERLHYKSQDLADFGIKLSKNKDILESTLKRLVNIKDKDGVDLAGLEEIIQYIKSQIRIDKRIDFFNNKVNTINYEFLNQIKGDYPNLTENELYMISLLKLKLTTKEIASIKNISADSVKVMRYRLRKKLKFTHQQTFSDFFRNYKGF